MVSTQELLSLFEESSKQKLIKHQMYGHLTSSLQIIQGRIIRHAWEVTTNSQATFFYGVLNMDTPVLTEQQRFTYIISVWTPMQVCQERWIIITEREREGGERNREGEREQEREREREREKDRNPFIIMMIMILMISWFWLYCRLFNTKSILYIETVLLQTIQFGVRTVFLFTHCWMSKQIYFRQFSLA